MSERRSLSDGLKTTPPQVDPEVAKAFIYGDKAKASTATASAATSPFSRVPITTRIRSEYAEALKRASLERQLNKIEPNTLQDILEQAIEPWLRNNSYIK